MSQQFVLFCSIPGPVVQLDNQEKFVRANLGMPVTELCLGQGWGIGGSLWMEGEWLPARGFWVKPIQMVSSSLFCCSIIPNNSNLRKEGRVHSGSV